MTEKTLPRVLCVDDEPNLLAALKRELRTHFDITTAGSGKDGLETLRTQAPFAVLVSDMRMPEMDGATFLGRAREAYPDTVRILMTGQADVTSAIEAINKGAIFRYLCKPCASDVLRAALDQAVSQYQLTQTERQLLETTLMASIKTLVEVLAIAAPWAHRRASFAQACVRHAMQKLRWPDSWIYEVAAALSQIGCVGVPQETVQRDAAQRPLTDTDAELMTEHPETAYRLLVSVPRLERVAEIVRYQIKSPPPDMPIEVVRGSELLRAALTLERHAARGKTIAHIIEAMAKEKPPLPAPLIAALAGFRETFSERRASLVQELIPGWVLDQDVNTAGGTPAAFKGS